MTTTATATATTAMIFFDAMGVATLFGYKIL